jgi:hypothetical protein
MRSISDTIKELRSPTLSDELQTSSGSGQGTLRGGLTAVGADMSSNGNRVPGDAVLVSPRQGVPTIWQRRTDRRGELWESPMSSSKRLSAEMMMMMVIQLECFYAQYNINL